jgi:septal ring factor EnvC (AmiA/AmiB activator)
MESEESNSCQNAIDDLERRLAQIEQQIGVVSLDVVRLKRLITHVSNRLVRSNDERELFQVHVRQFVYALQNAAQQFVQNEQSP